MRSFFKRKSITKNHDFYAPKGHYKLLRFFGTDNQDVGISDYKFFCAFFVMVACLRHAVGVGYGVWLGPHTALRLVWGK